MKLQVIGSVDDTRRQAGPFVLGDRDSTPSARPIVYISREQCIQQKLRNAVVSLSLRSDSRPIYATVRIYSKESAMFTKDAHYPVKLLSQAADGGAVGVWQVIASNLLWWELELERTQSQASEFQEHLSMPKTQAPINVEATIVTSLGSATLLTLTMPAVTSKVQTRLNGKAIAQSLSGSVVSLGGWISYKTPYGSQSFQITHLTATQNTYQTAALMSEATVVRYTLDKPSLSIASGESQASGLIPKDHWIELIKRDIGGYDDILRQITDHMYGFIQSAVQGLESNQMCFATPFKGLLISGRPGTGKSALASSLAGNSGLPYSIINCPDVFQTDQGASENYLRNAFSSLLSRGKASILILDEVDMIASGRASRKGAEAKIYTTLLNIVDSINTQPKGHKVFILALTNRLHAVDPSLTRSGRLDKVFDLHLKGVDQRLRALEILSKDLPMAPEQRPNILKKVARATHGFVPTDLQSLCTESALRLISEMNAGVEEPMIDYSYFEAALKTIRPSGMGEFLSKIPTVTFKDLYGIQNAIADLRVSIIDPFHSPQKYLDLGIVPPRGVIIHGPPGVGKTMLCCALAEELGINFMLVESSQIRSKVVGESEQNIARMFAQAKANAPCILFIDQIDVLAPARGSTHTSENSGDRIVTGLLTEMDGFFSASAGKSAEVDVLVLAATNRPEVIDTAILRPGRLDQIVYIPVPDLTTRQAILEGYMAKMPMRVTEQEVRQLAEETEGYSGADLENLCREAALICLRQDIRHTEILLEHLQAAKLVSKPSLLGYQETSLFSS